MNLLLIAYASSEGSGSLPEPPLLAHTSSESRGRGTFRQKARSLAPLNGWAGAFKICHDGMLEDTNSLDAPQLWTKIILSKCSKWFDPTLNQILSMMLCSSIVEPFRWNCKEFLRKVYNPAYKDITYVLYVTNTTVPLTVCVLFTSYIFYSFLAENVPCIWWWCGGNKYTEYIFSVDSHYYRHCLIEALTDKTVAAQVGIYEAVWIISYRAKKRKKKTSFNINSLLCSSALYGTSYEVAVWNSKHH